MMNRERLLTLAFLLTVFLLALCKIEETDAWMHLSLGREIAHLRGFPANEFLTYTTPERPFYYSSWLFGLVYYLAYVVLNTHGVILLKAVTVTAVFYVLLRDSLRPHSNYFIAIAVMTIVVIMTRYRFVERPDTFLMLFLSFTVFSLNAFVRDNKKYLFALPGVHMLWANSHSSIILMFVPFLSFLVGGFLQRHLNVRGMLSFPAPSSSQMKTIALVFVLSFAASLINPNFISEYFYGTTVITTSWWNQELLEFRRPSWVVSTWLSLLVVVLIASFVLNKKRLSLAHIFLVVPFVVLSFSVVRFVFLFAIIMGPVFANNLSSFVEGRHWREALFRRPATVVLLVWLITYTSLGIANALPLSDNRKTFGFGIDYRTVPENALRFMDANGITGRVFNAFAWGGYIIWRDFPKRSVFVENRGHLPNDLLEKMLSARSNKPQELDALERAYGFESVLIDYPRISSNLLAALVGNDLSLHHPGWALVYWDDIALLYLKRGGRYDSIIEKYEYRFAKPSNGSRGVTSWFPDERSQAGLWEELRRNIRDTGSSRAYTLLGALCNEMKLYPGAIDAFKKSLGSPLGNRIDAYSGMARAYLSLGEVDKAIEYDKKSLSLHEDATTLYRLGEDYLSKGDKKTSLEYFERALSRNQNLTSVYPRLAGIYRELGMNEKAARLTAMQGKALQVQEGEEHFRNGLAAYYAEKYDIAMEELKKSIEANPENPVSYSNLGYVYFDAGMIEEAYRYQLNALTIDPHYANAHYGLALIFKRWGDMSMAQKHWEEYLRIEPEGYFSRKAREEIRAIEKPQ